MPLIYIYVVLGSVCKVSCTNSFEMGTGHFKSKEEVSAILESVGISLRSPPDQIVTTCGSGVTAAVVRLAMGGPVAT